MKIVQTPRLIGVCGKPQSGKDTAAAILMKEFGYSYAAFGDAIRTELTPILMYHARIPHEILDNPKLEKLASALIECRGINPWQKPTPDKLREVMQMYGTDFRRAQDPMYWTRLTDLSGRKVVPGVREPEQLQAIKQRQGLCIWIHRTFREHTPQHQSEEMIEPSDCDVIVFNDYTIQDLQWQLAAAVSLRCV